MMELDRDSENVLKFLIAYTEKNKPGFEILEIRKELKRKSIIPKGHTVTEYIDHLCKYGLLVQYTEDNFGQTLAGMLMLTHEGRRYFHKKYNTLMERFVWSILIPLSNYRACRIGLSY